MTSDVTFSISDDVGGESKNDCELRSKVSSGEKNERTEMSFSVKGIEPCFGSLDV